MIPDAVKKIEQVAFQILVPAHCVCEQALLKLFLQSYFYHSSINF